MTARKDDIFEKIVKTICDIYHDCGQEVYNLYSNNGTHVHDPTKDQALRKETALSLENKIYSKALKDFCDFLKLQPNIESFDSTELQKSVEAFTDFVDGRAIYQTSVIMKFIKEYQIPLDPSKLLEKAIRSVMNEHYRKQKFYPKRKAPVIPPPKEHGPNYLSDFSETDDEQS